MHGIVNDSSFAAVSSTDGSKHVFFQDLTGQLRHKYYGQSSGTWSTGNITVISGTTDARYHTPLAAMMGNGISGSDEVNLGSALLEYVI